MFSWRNKLREPFGKQPSPEEDNSTVGEEPDEDAPKAEDTLITQTASEDAPKAEDTLITQTVSLEEVENIASDLDEAQAKSPEEGEDVLTQPVQPEEEPAAEEKDVNVLPGSADDKESKPKNEGEGDSLSNLFSQDEEEENPLAGLIASLPDVAARELLGEAQEVEEMLRKWQQS